MEAATDRAAFSTGHFEPSCRLGAGAWGVASRLSLTINGDKTDNRLANLRDVTRLENARNMPRPKNNTSGVLGVSWSKSHGKWAARIKVEGRKLSAGHFDKFRRCLCARRAANVTFGFNVRTTVAVEMAPNGRLDDLFANYA